MSNPYGRLELPSTVGLRGGKAMSHGQKVGVGVSVGVILLTAVILVILLVPCYSYCAPNSKECGDTGTTCSSWKKYCKSSNKKCAAGQTCTADGTCTGVPDTWGCSADGSGECVKQIDGKGAYRSADACKCSYCQKGVANPQGQCTTINEPSKTGMYKTNADCMANDAAKCGWTYNCPSAAASRLTRMGRGYRHGRGHGATAPTGLCVLSPDPDGALTADACNTASQCGWTYGCDGTATCSKSYPGGGFGTPEECTCYTCDTSGPGGKPSCKLVAPGDKGSLQRSDCGSCTAGGYVCDPTVTTNDQSAKWDGSSSSTITDLANTKCWSCAGDGTCNVTADSTGVGGSFNTKALCTCYNCDSSGTGQPKCVTTAAGAVGESTLTDCKTGCGQKGGYVCDATLTDVAQRAKWDAESASTITDIANTLCWKCTAGGTCEALTDATGHSGQFNTADACSGDTGKCGWKFGCNGDTGCVQMETGGTWDSVTDCKCWKCNNGICSSVSTGTADFVSKDDCEGGVGKCGWSYGCDASSGANACSLMQTGGKWATAEDCKCWKCSGNDPGPTSSCISVSDNTSGVFADNATCHADPSAKCGWTYKCST